MDRFIAHRINQKGIPPVKINGAALTDAVAKRLRNGQARFEELFLVLPYHERGSFKLETPWGELPVFFEPEAPKQYLLNTRKFKYPSELGRRTASLSFEQKDKPLVTLN